MRIGTTLDVNVQRGRMIGMWEAGMPIIQIATRMGTSARTVHRWIKRWESEMSLETKPRSGRPPGTTRKQEKRKADAKQDPLAGVKQDSLAYVEQGLSAYVEHDPSAFVKQDSLAHIEQDHSADVKQYPLAYVESEYVDQDSPADVKQDSLADVE